MPTAHLSTRLEPRDAAPGQTTPRASAPRLPRPTPLRALRPITLICLSRVLARGGLRFGSLMNGPDPASPNLAFDGPGWYRIRIAAQGRDTPRRADSTPRGRRRHRPHHPGGDRRQPRRPRLVRRPHRRPRHPLPHLLTRAPTQPSGTLSNGRTRTPGPAEHALVTPRFVH
ncbi:hypothetical protein FRACA_610024 [Frankia canadensis]|uniref:Uncharacterized protein n=1 Tax=Frankia canadensis TaxID=1836972 RepID=A0A2I2KZQ2_9ACTN|nr:hypothetical protein FRACA_610024 [Frankia canadensis]SOU58433.1 hypothetical protein FRACA_610024 [Frankia canadensis]